MKRFYIYLALEKFIIRIDNQAVKGFLKSKKGEDNQIRNSEQISKSWIKKENELLFNQDNGCKLERRF